MAIDIRATVTCSLGTLISGSISDDYIQGSGLVKTRGSVEIAGVITPALGTVVTFAYTKGGVTRSIPRKLRVLSSFADPFRRTTKVELGCKLTYFSDLKPAPTVNGDNEVETGKRLACLNGYTGFNKDTQFGIPLYAADLANQCLSKLGITLASGTMPLKGQFYVDSFDLTPGYVTVLSDLLLSESYCGHLNEQEQLVLLDLTADGGSGPVVTSNDIVDLSAINVGTLPGDAVVVRYKSVELKQDLENEDEQIIRQRDWTEDEVVGSVETVVIRFSTLNGTIFTNVYSYIPYTKTVSEYGQDESWDDNVCVLYSSAGEGADLSDTVIKRTTTRNVLKAEAANNYCAQLLGVGFDPGAAEQGFSETVETYEYDNDGQPTRRITETWEPFFAWAGRLGLDFLYEQDGSQSAVILGTNPVLVSRVVVEITTLYAALPSIIRLDPGETYRRLVNGQKVVTTTYTNWALTQAGEQATADIKQFSPFTSALACAEYLNSISDKFVLSNTTIESSRDRTLVGIDRRPAVAERMGNGDGARTENTSELVYVTGSPTSQRIVEFSLPYSSDDARTSSGAIIRGKAKELATRYGRVQNRLLLGNRSGMNLQLAPERLPAAPFSPLYVEANGLTALYRANGTNWAFDSNGIVCSIDALFWGAVGGTGTFWFPVAPGITALPTTPPVVDTAPTAVIGTVATVGAAPQTTLNTAFPTAISGDGVQDQATSNFWVYDGTSWDDVGPTPGPTTEATSVVLPYNETAIYDARLTLTAAVTKFDYALTLLTVVPPLRVRLQAQVFDVTLLAAVAGSLTFTGQAAALVRRYRLQAAATSFAVTGFSAGSIRDYAIGTNAGSFTAEGQPAALRVDRNPLAAEAGSFAATGQDAILRVVQPLRGDAGAFALTGEAANFIRSLRLPAEATSYSVTGSAAGLFAEDYFSRWATQTYGYEGLVYPSWWAD